MMTNRFHVVAVVMVIGGVQDILMDKGEMMMTIVHQKDTKLGELRHATLRNW
jgi:hypothetical protein